MLDTLIQYFFMICKYKKVISVTRIYIHKKNVILKNVLCIKLDTKRPEIVY